MIAMGGGLLAFFLCLFIGFEMLTFTVYGRDAWGDDGGADRRAFPIA